MKNFNYPAQTGDYIVKVKNGARWREYDTCRLQISVGGERHEGEKFAATMAWCKARFKTVIVCVNDTLQRFNLMNLGLSPDEACRRAAKAGEEWIERNAAALEGCRVVRWDSWRLAAAFPQTHEDVKEYYRQREPFRAAIAEAIKNPYSVDYLLEEIAVFMLMDRAMKGVDIYPGTLPRAIDMVRDTHTTRIDFVRSPAPPNP